MLLNLFILCISLTPSLGAVSPKGNKSADNSRILYQQALDQVGSKKSCANFKKIASSSSYELNELAKLRHAQHCEKKPNWEALESQISNNVLKKFFTQSWFDFERNNKRFGNAYLVYKKNKKNISIDKKEYEEMALGALRTRLSKKDKKTLRANLRKKSPRFIPYPNKSQYLKVAKDYRRDRQFEKALSYYRKVINDPKMSYHQRWYAFKGARATYKLERWKRMEKYIRSSKQWANFLRKKYKWSKELTHLHHDANIEYIRTLWTEKGQTQAKKELNRLEKEMKGRHSLQLVYWLKGRMFEEVKDYKNAVLWLSKAATEKSLSDRNKQRVLWMLAWNQRRTQQYKESQKNLDKLKKSPDLTFFAKTKYLYWQAENLEAMGQSMDAKAAFKRLANFDLYGYYGALAYRKMNTTFPIPPNKKMNDDGVFSLINKSDQNYLKELTHVGELEVAEELVLKRVKTDRKWKTDKWVAYLSLLQKAGAYKTSFIRYHTLPPKIQLDITENHPYILFPQPYKDEVLESAKQTRVSSSLIYSIMKQESGFDVKARSHADAFGLLQLIPQVAEKAAARMPEIPYKTPRDLFKPNVIIPLGANNLSYLFSKFDSNFILSVASYNASEKAVRGWVDSRFQGDPITFIEDIPYEETKGYVKLVMRNYITYNRFDSKGDDFKFPEVCLQGLQAFKK